MSWAQKQDEVYAMDSAGGLVSYIQYMGLYLNSSVCTFMTSDILKAV